MSVRVLSAVWDRAPYDGPAFVTLLALADWADDEGRCYPSITKLAMKSRLGLTATKNALKRLKSDGVLVVETSGNCRTSNRYRLIVELLSRPPGDLGRETAQATTRPRVGRETTEGRPPGDLGVGRETTPNRHMNRQGTVIEPSKGKFTVPDCIPQQLWNDFEEMRKKLRKPLTEKAKQLTLRELLKLRDAGHDPVAVLEQSIANSWQGVFPLKKQAAAMQPAKRIYAGTAEYEAKYGKDAISPAIERQRRSNAAIEEAGALLARAYELDDSGESELPIPGADGGNLGLMARRMD